MHRLGVFLNGGGHHLVDTSVVSEMNDFTSGSLHDAAHDVDRGIVTVNRLAAVTIRTLCLGV